MITVVGLYWYLKPVPVVKNIVPSVPVVKNIVPSNVIGVFISGTVKSVSGIYSNYDYVFYGSDNKPFFPSDWGYVVVPVSMCKADIRGENFSFSVSCGGRKFIEPLPASNSGMVSDKIFDISKINPFDK